MSGDHLESKRPDDDNSESSDRSLSDASSSVNASKKRKRDSKHRHKKRSSKKRKSSHHLDSNSDDDESSGRRRKRSKSKRRHHRDDRSVSSSSSESSSERRKRKKRKKHNKDKKRKKEKKKVRRSKDDKDDGVPSFGKYGVIKSSDYHKMQRTFTVWLEEVKGIMDFSGPKWELQNYFKDYMEDYNTATLPHVKYYDYDKWEMEEYQKQKEDNAAAQKSSVQRDEALHMQRLQEKARQKREEELKLVKDLMSKEKRDEMKRKADLQAEMAHAYKTGDQETYKRLKARLEPEK